MRVVLLGLVLLLAACADRGAVRANLPPAPTYVVFFEADSTSLTQEARAVVTEVAAKVKAVRPSTVMVEGYAGRPGTPAKNQELSRQRVETVVRALAEAGVASSDVLKIAKGEKTAGLDPTGDRRVEITLQSAR